MLDIDANQNKGGKAKTDPAKEAERLLDIISAAKHISTALSEIKSKNDSVLPKTDLNNLNLLIAALDNLHDSGRKQTAKVSVLSYLLRAYDMRKAAEREKENVYPKKGRSVSIQRVKMFLDKCHGKESKGNVALKSIDMNAVQIARRSKRQKNCVTLEKSSDKKKQLFTGAPPNGTWWTKASLCQAMRELEGTGTTKSFIDAVLGAGKCDYKSHTSLYRMYGSYKSKGGIVPKGRGRPMKMGTEEAETIATQALRSCDGDSSTFQLNDMKAAYISKMKAEAEDNGLEGDTIDCKISDRLAKAALIAASMGTSELSASRKKLITKTETRYISEHSVMGGYAYATTVLSTHFIEGRRPTSLGRFRPERLSKSAKETVLWVKQAYGATEVYPVNPNLVLSTDDTTLFVFEGTSVDSDWEWKLIDSTKEDTSVRSDFQVGDDAENSGGLRVRLTFTFAASGLAAPPYISVSGLTDEEMSVEKCPDGVIATPVKGLCKGGDDIFNEGMGWLVFLRADKKGVKDRPLSVANKKFMHYNDNVLLPFIRAIREKLGWRPGQPVPDWLKAVSWSDGDIGQLQTLLMEAREALDEAEKIVRNKHSAAATGTQQPCDLSPVFRLLKQLQKITTSKDDVIVGLRETIEELFAVDLRRHGLNLDSNPRKKRALIDFLLSLPELLEATMKKKNIRKPFVEAGMIDDETGMVPVFDRLIGTCKRWVSATKEVGISRVVKQHCRKQFQGLMEIQLENGQISYSDMRGVGIPEDIDSKGNVVSKDRPCGAIAEHMQAAKTINAAAQKQKREEKRRKKAAVDYSKSEIERNVVQHILDRNKSVENVIISKCGGTSLADAGACHFLALTVAQLKDFIHARSFDGQTFQTSNLAGSSGKLNKVRFKGQTAEMIENDCSDDEPCLVWIAWKLRAKELVLKQRAQVAIDLRVPTPEFTVVCASRPAIKTPSEYLRNSSWVQSLSLFIRGVDFVTIDDELIKNADKLALSLAPRLEYHIAERVDCSRQKHWTLQFTRDNLAPMAAGMCLVGHIVSDLDTFDITECLMKLPMDELFQIVTGDLGKLEGCYLYYDRKKNKWIRSGKTSGDGDAACFAGRGNKHEQNARCKDEMRKHPLYARYPAFGVDNVGAREGYFENLDMYCAMSFHSKSDVTALCSHDLENSLFVWSGETMEEIKKKGGVLQKHQLDAVSYLWELCYDLLLARSDNISVSPGFESFGLRVNAKKRKLDNDEVVYW